MSLESAIDLDRREDVVGASQAYEESLGKEEGSHVALLNLLVLYWQATDFGFSSKRGLSPEFVTHASRRLRVLLAGNAAYRLDPGFVFWSKYIAWADLGESLSVEECRRLLRADPKQLDPAMFIFTSSHGRECSNEAMELLDRTAKDKTARARYIESVLRSTIQVYASK